VIDLNQISANLSKSENGIWTSPSNTNIPYPETGNEDCYQLEKLSYWFRHRNRCITVVIRSFPPDGPIFDIGGGNGFVTKAIIESGFNGILVESGRQGIKNAFQEHCVH